MSSLEKVVRRDVKALYDFVREVYPAADTDAVIDRTFSHARVWPLDQPERQIRLRLFGEARSHIHRHHNRAWRRHNCALVRDALHEHARRTRDWHTWTELSRLTNALLTLSVEHHELLNIASAADVATADEVALLLHRPTGQAWSEFTDARSQFRRAYNNLLADDESAEAGT